MVFKKWKVSERNVNNITQLTQAHKHIAHTIYKYNIVNYKHA